MGQRAVLDDGKNDGQILLHSRFRIIGAKGKEEEGKFTGKLREEGGVRSPAESAGEGKKLT